MAFAPHVLTLLLNTLLLVCLPRHASHYALKITVLLYADYAIYYSSLRYFHLRLHFLFFSLNSPCLGRDCEISGLPR